MCVNSRALIKAEFGAGESLAFHNHTAAWEEMSRWSIPEFHRAESMPYLNRPGIRAGQGKYPYERRSCVLTAGDLMGPLSDGFSISGHHQEYKHYHNSSHKHFFEADNGLSFVPEKN